jgi:hypothetical protein
LTLRESQLPEIQEGGRRRQPVSEGAPDSITRGRHPKPPGILLQNFAEAEQPGNTDALDSIRREPHPQSLHIPLETLQEAAQPGSEEALASINRSRHPKPPNIPRRTLAEAVQPYAASDSIKRGRPPFGGSPQLEPLLTKVWMRGSYGATNTGELEDPQPELPQAMGSGSDLRKQDVSIATLLNYANELDDSQPKPLPGMDSGHDAINQESNNSIHPSDEYEDPQAEPSPVLDSDSEVRTDVSNISINSIPKEYQGPQTEPSHMTESGSGEEMLSVEQPPQTKGVSWCTSANTRTHRTLKTMHVCSCPPPSIVQQTLT